MTLRLRKRRRVIFGAASNPIPHRYTTKANSPSVRFKKRGLRGLLKQIFFEPIFYVTPVMLEESLLDERGRVLVSRVGRALLLHPPILEVSEGVEEEEGA